MSFERQKFETRLTVKKNQEVGERLQVERLRDALRDLLDPTMPVEKLNRDNITSLALDFAEAHVVLARTLKDIDTLKDHLGQ